MTTIYSPSIIQRARAAAARAVRGRQSAAAMALPSTKASEGFAVGGCDQGCSPRPGSSPESRPAPCTGVAFARTHNECYHELARKHGCPMQVASGGLRGVAAGSPFTFQVQPTQSNFFLPVAVRLVAVNGTNFFTRIPTLLTAVTVKNIPQETYHEPSPTTATVQGVDFTSYDGKSGAGAEYGVPGWEIAWSPFSRISLADQLSLTGINLDVAELADVRAEVWGYEIDSLPSGWQCGRHPCRGAATA